MMAVVHVLLFLCTALPVSGQIRILSPKSLAHKFSNQGRITGSTATFGAPFYGDRVLGRLLWADSKAETGRTHCTEEDYSLPEQDASTKDSGKGSELIDIVLVRRGGCAFTKKVDIASKKGAHAVIIVDRPDSLLTAEDMSRTIVADDGYGDAVHIPSILISNVEGERLIEAAQSSNVVVSLVWEIPQNHVVEMDLWMSSGSQQSMEFLRAFSEKRKTLNEVVQFRPHYSVFSVNGNDPLQKASIFNDICSDNTGTYCTADPDGSGAVTGRDVLEEDVRQLCIHEITKVPRTSLNDLRAGKSMVEYAEKFWNYVEQLALECPFDGTDPNTRFGTQCAERVMKKVGLDVSRVQRCAETTKDEKLHNELANTAWSPRALRINGWRYSGMMDADLVTRAICSGFIEQPAECQKLVEPRKPWEEYNGGDIPAGGIGFGTLILSLLVLVCMSLTALVFYKRYIAKEVHRSVREQVMLEVNSQMGQYLQFKEDALVDI